jgi:hypothetical protein
VNEYPNAAKENLLTLIAEMTTAPEPHVKRPGKDFTRNRKLPFDDMLKLLITMGGNSLCKELLEAQNYDANCVTTSAFVQQRDKILPSALAFLFRAFTASHPCDHHFRGHRLLAVDGTDLKIAMNPSDSDTFFQNRPSEKGYNLLHLNAMYDLCNRLYVDLVVQPRRLENERSALIDMLHRFDGNQNVILIGDRGYESHNIFAHIEEKGWRYVFRVKDASANGILSGLPLPLSGEFDISYQRILTRQKTKKVKENSHIYKFIPTNSKFDFLDRRENLFYTFSFRALRVQLPDGSFETLVTNLPGSDFSADDLKHIYKMRWGIETSFRKLKHTIGLTNFHAKKKEHIIQEIFARAIMYNFTEMIASSIVISKADAQYPYQINFVVAVLVCRYFLRYQNLPPPDIKALLCKNVLPIRPNRTFSRKTRAKPTVSFNYRVA